MPGMNGEFVPAPTLALSNHHHMVIGHDLRNRPDTPENLHRPAHEFKSDEDLWEYLRGQISLVRERRVGLEGLDHDAPTREFYQTIWYDMLLKNLRYLAIIKRLPPEIDLAALEAELKMPD